MSVARAQATQPAPPAADNLLIHLPGIAGERNLDRGMVHALKEGGFTGDTEIIDWTENDPGLHALFADQRNHAEAAGVAKRIVERRAAHPSGKIIVTAHSGGAGIIVWALEQLPPGANVDTVFLLAPALSPTYDLSPALAHVRGSVYAFTSLNDLAVLGIGTKLFRTIDGQQTEAAGLRGFVMPAGADASLYKKLIPMPYDKAWMRYGNLGDHIGPLRARFALNVLAPLASGKLPIVPVRVDPKSTLPSDTSASK